MKHPHYFLALLLVLTCFTRVSAQLFTVGAKVGFNYTSLPTSSSVVTSQAGKAGFQVGVFARLGNKTYLQPEILIGSHEAKFTFDPGQGTTTYPQDAKFTTLEVPILLGHKFFSLPLFNFRGMIGPDFAFQLKKPGIQIPNPSDYTYKDANVGAIVGLGVDIANFTVDARYNFGISEINRGFGQRLNYFNLSLGLKFL